MTIMKRINIILALLMLTAQTATGQEKAFTPTLEDSIEFVITGTTTSTEDSVVWWPCAPFMPYAFEKSVPVKEGRFRVEGKLPRHHFIQIDNLHFIVEETPTYVNLETCEVTGSEQQSKFIRIQQQEREIEKAMWGNLTEDEQDYVMNMVAGAIPMKTAQDSIRVQRYNDAWAAIDSLRLTCYGENLDNMLPAYYLYVNHMNLKLEELERFMLADAPYARHPAMSHVWKQYWGLLEQNRIVNNSFRDFEAETPDNVIHHLSEYAGRGDYVLLDFWASWCAPCIGAFPMMRQLHEAYSPQGLQIIGISIDQDSSKWHNALEKYNLPWLQLRETTSTQSNKTAASDLYGITAVPTLVLIGPDGKVISTDLEKEELKLKLAEIFNGAIE